MEFILVGEDNNHSVYVKYIVCLALLREMNQGRDAREFCLVSNFH